VSANYFLHEELARMPCGILIQSFLIICVGHISFLLWN